MSDSNYNFVNADFLGVFPYLMRWVIFVVNFA